ncbi:hypothetical protein F5Y12DRAFT_748332 [Xylaria sp. FL1777]|nr:hypothetical protein F5Y12DRAFT_748332 [Xylaria sp. FL1777]
MYFVTGILTLLHPHSSSLGHNASVIHEVTITLQVSYQLYYNARKGVLITSLVDLPPSQVLINSTGTNIVSQSCAPSA